MQSQLSMTLFIELMLSQPVQDPPPASFISNKQKEWTNSFLLLKPKQEISSLLAPQYYTVASARAVWTWRCLVMLMNPLVNNSKHGKLPSTSAFVWNPPDPHPRLPPPPPVLFMMFCVGQAPSGFKVSLWGINRSLYPAVEYIDVSIQQSLHVISPFNVTGSAEKCFLFHMVRQSGSQQQKIKLAVAYREGLHLIFTMFRGWWIWSSAGWIRPAAW